jgi:hypothetical protein
MPPTVLPDPLKALEDAAYAGVDDAAEEAGAPRVNYNLGPAIYERPYRPGTLKPWPIHTDFRPHETTAEERGRYD